MHPFRRSPPGVAFCGVLDADTRTLYLCPLVPMKGSVDFPEKMTKDSYIKDGVQAVPILHTDIKVRQATGTGEASHDQLAKRVDPGQSHKFVGFTIWKGPEGDAVTFSFTSRSQNTSAFGESATVAEIAAEQQRNRVALAAQAADRVRFEAEEAAFQQNAAATRAENLRRAANRPAGGGAPPPPLPPPTPVGSHGFNLQAQTNANMTAIGGKGTNEDGIVSMPYAIAILQTLRAHFRAGDRVWEV